MSIHVCKCSHNGREEYHLRYPGMSEQEAQGLADRINGGGELCQKQAALADQPSHRWNIERDGDALLICFDAHEKDEKCEYVRYVPAEQPEPDHAIAGVLLTAAAKSGDPGALSLAAQLAGCAPCQSCGYVHNHCRCAKLPKADIDAKRRSDSA